MNPARRATPDSEAVGSSEDERPWPSSMPFGNTAMKENSIPGMPGGIWGTKKRGSFKISDVAQRNAARDAARMGAAAANAPVGALRGASTPSPSVSEGASALPFAIPLHPTPKTGRSLSHSQGQRETPLSSSGHIGTAAGPTAAGQLPLGLLAEEDADTDTESDIGSRLTHTTSHPPIGTLMRTATMPVSYDTMHSANGRGDRSGAPLSPSHHDLMRTRTFEAAFANLSIDRGCAIDHSHRRASQWQSSLGWDDVPNVNESRRHSLADIPTRRGSLAGGEPSMLSRTYTHDVFETESPTSLGSAHLQGFPSDRAVDTNSDHNATTPRNNITSSNMSNNYQIPAMYRVPTVHLQEHELREVDQRRDVQPWASGGGGRGNPRRLLYVVSFKCSRVDVFYLLDNTGLVVREGDLVIVEADRGQDLGTVQHANVTQEVARMLKKKYSEEQYKWLMMYSRNKEGGNNPNAQMHGEQQLFPDAPTTMQGNIPRESLNNLKPKAIKRLANEHEIQMLAEKEGNEAKAKRTCQQKVTHLHLQMEILDAEWQWDFQKLIFYYYADHYINFKDLITELYRIYKTRIWLSAINPASFSHHAMGQPPTGIGPGAVGPYGSYGLNNGYTMAYGEDRDPYGAQMPYNIGYQTYNPNYPAIPGVANSFAPTPYGNTTPYDHYGATSVQNSPGTMMAPQTGGAPANMAGGGQTYVPAMVEYARAGQDPMNWGRLANDENERLAARDPNAPQQYVRAPQTSISPPRDSEQRVASGSSIPEDVTSIRRQQPQPIGTRRPSQAGDWDTTNNRARTMSGGPSGPQFPSPFRSGGRPEMRFLGRTEDEGGLYQNVQQPSNADNGANASVNANSNGNGNGNGHGSGSGNTIYNAYQASFANGQVTAQGNAGGASRVGRASGPFDSTADTLPGLPYFLPHPNSARLD